jgi:hypothetical protein
LVRSAGDAKCEIIDTTFFLNICKVIQNQLQKLYYAGLPGARRLWRVGEELAAGIRTKICGEGNINNNHWIGYVVEVDTTQSKFLYGDSFGNEPIAEVAMAFHWWTTTHVKEWFSHGKLAISPQTDNHLCGILSTNAVAHNVLPKSMVLVDESDVEEACISLYARVAKWDLESVIIL